MGFGELVQVNPLATTIVDTSPYHPGGPVADSMQFVFNWVLIASLVLGVFTAVLLLYSMFRFRRKHDDDAPKQFHGNTRLEIFWTLVPLVIFLSLFGLTISQMGFINDAPASTAANPVMHVTVIGQQFSWTFDYSGKQTTSGNDVLSFTTLHVPADTPVDLQVVSTDPPCVIKPNGTASSGIAAQKSATLRQKLSTGESLADAISDQGCGVNHSFYVPSLAGQINAIPGQTNHMWLQARTGHYYGQCTELCGTGHASMLLEVVAESQAQFDQWMLQQTSK
ncbi:MAG TPA: cytochrome c oxidase subunit II transmembrane domain-containing protein [Candidatus Deferrimicrobium sp.]|nr:cytochrome c oxidase subunit II transmembrane domain-containing protein [Candidatus Deferrimicrobium sp.]